MVNRRQVLLAASGLAIGGLTGCSTGPSGPTVSGATSPTPSPTSLTSTSTASPSSSPSATSSSPASSPEGPPKPKVAGTVAEDLDVPWGIAFLPSGDALVGERGTARLLRISATGQTTTLGTVGGVSAPSGSGEGGLLGLALAPGDPETLFAYLTSRSDNRVVRISLAGGRVGRPRPVLTGIPTSTHHHGGRLLFAPDGTLFVSTGDAEQSGLAQDRTSLAGKVLRIRTDGRAARDNPFGNRTWSYGHRNIEGLAFDDAGRLWATEFGEKEADELNVVQRGGNYGWPAVEGRSRDSRYRPPAVSWSPTSSCSPSGLAITGSTAFVGALQGQCLFAVRLDKTSAAKPRAYFVRDHGRLRTVVHAPDGSLWVTTSNTDGRVTPGRHDDKILRITL